ncbi:iron chaperone [Pseudoalteromonas sp.]|uniref:iron chaperone n=1 Tax=Pseudoalteromonas sp. TaxID=53249 RepID=UPI00356546F1
MTKFVDHDAYIAAAPLDLQPLLRQLHIQLTQVLPDAEELIAYDMPGFGFGKSIIVGYAAFSKQCGIYVSKGAITAHADAITAAGLKASKTGVTFSVRKPIPDELLKKLATTSREELGL